MFDKLEKLLDVTIVIKCCNQQGIQPLQSRIPPLLLPFSPSSPPSCQSNFLFLDPEYLSQVRSELHETFGKTSCGYLNMIQHSKFNQTIHNSSQEPSTSSKYACVLNTLIFILGGLKIDIQLNYYLLW